MKKAICVLLALLPVIFLIPTAALAADTPFCADAKAAVLIEVKSGRVLAERNADEPLPVASTTKIMSALLTLEEENLDEPFVVDADAICVEGTSMGLKEGDTVTLRTLAWGMLLASGNDAANAAAVRISGSLESFADKMNARAGALGMENTVFTTPSGLEVGSPRSTARDMAILAREALANEDFARMAATERVHLSYGNPPYDRWIKNHNRLLERDERVIGVKTGFTKAAGRCLVSAARQGDLTLIAVTLGCPDDFHTHTAIYDEYFNALEYVEMRHMADGFSAPVTGAERQSLPVCIDGSFGAYLTNEERGEVEIDLLVQPFLYAPVKKGDCIGTARLTLDGVVLDEAQLNSAADRAGFYHNRSVIERVEQFFEITERRFFGFPFLDGR